MAYMLVATAKAQGAVFDPAVKSIQSAMLAWWLETSSSTIPGATPTGRLNGFL